MRKVREMLRLHFEMGASNREIARSLSVSHSTVNGLLGRFKSAGMSWPLPGEVDEAGLEAVLYPGNTGKSRRRPEPDWNQVHRELSRKGITLQLLWFEYKDRHPDGYQYSQFCEPALARQARRRHAPGAPGRGEGLRRLRRAPDGRHRPPDRPDHPGPHLRGQSGGFELHLRGGDGGRGPPLLHRGPLPGVRVLRRRPGGARTGQPQSRGHPSLPLRAGSQSHLPRCGKPLRDGRHPGPGRAAQGQAKVEAAVGNVERRVLAPLRNRTFFSLAEINEAIGDLARALNDRPFQKLEGSRRSLFEELDRPALRSLPPSRYEFAEWKKSRVNVDYHIEVE